MKTNDLLLALGVSLCFLSVILRGLHQGQRRAEALRSQTARFARVSGREDTLNASAPPAHPFLRYLPWLYRVLGLVGAALALYAFAHR